MLRQALDLNDAPDHVAYDHGFDPASLASFIEAQIADVASLFNPPPDMIVSGEETTIADAAIDIDASNPMVINSTGHRLADTSRCLGWQRSREGTAAVCCCEENKRELRHVVLIEGLEFMRRFSFLWFSRA